MKVYIAGAITNNMDYVKQFNEAEERLVAAGYSVINPTKNQGYSYKEYIDIGLYELMHCDAIYMLEGWEKSTGATLEHTYAEAVGLMIINETDKYIKLAETKKLIKTIETILYEYICKGCSACCICTEEGLQMECEHYKEQHGWLVDVMTGTPIKEGNNETTKETHKS